MIRMREDQTGLIVTGQIIYTNVLSLRQLGKQLLTKCQQSQVLIDLSQVTQVDNVALALLTAWMRDARKLNKSITYENLPLSLEQMATVSGVDFLFKKTQHIRPNING